MIREPCPHPRHVGMFHGNLLRLFNLVLRPANHRAVVAGNLGTEVVHLPLIRRVGIGLRRTGRGGRRRTSRVLVKFQRVEVREVTRVAVEVF